MRISLRWVNELVNLKNVNFEYLLEKLTLGGFEIEDNFDININNKVETIIDISTTANRADSLSVKGIAKEITALMNQPPKISSWLHNHFELETIVRKSLLNNDKLIDCTNFITISISNLNVLDSPKWLKDKLISNGLVPLNNLLDFRNYVLLETGYPFEFYDLDRVQKDSNQSNLNLKLAFANNQTSLIGENDVIYQLNKDILLVKNNQQILSIAGIISNKKFSYLETTKTLLIEGSIFNSKRIRQMSRILGLRTERSARYQKGLNSSNFLQAFTRLISLLKITNPALTCKLYNISTQNKKKLDKVELTYQSILQILGPINSKNENQNYHLTQLQISEYLSQLQFNFVFNQEKSIWKVEIPESRATDITREIDLIEEIGRLHGFNDFITCLPIITKIGSEDISYQCRKKINSCFLNEGFNELVHYSLINEQTNNNIKIVNPLIKDYSVLRTTLLTNILLTTRENLKQGNFSLEGFEYGHIFSKNFGSKKYEEIEYIGGIFTGLKSVNDWLETDKTSSWFYAKGRMETIFNKLNILVNWENDLPSLYTNLFHPYRSAQIVLMNKKPLGVFGQIHPILAKKINISSNIYLFEINFELIKIVLKNSKLPSYESYSLYPKIIKDLAFIIDQNISYEEIETLIIGNGTKFLTQVILLDEYRGKPIPDKFKSLCIQLTFQSSTKTLVTLEIEKIILNIQAILKKQFNITIRH